MHHFDPLFYDAARCHVCNEPSGHHNHDPASCGRCGKTGEPSWESCWFCLTDLCYECWDRVGHCGHEEARAMNRAANDAARRAVIRDYDLGGRGR